MVNLTEDFADDGPFRATVQFLKLPSVAATLDKRTVAIVVCAMIAGHLVEDCQYEPLLSKPTEDSIKLMSKNLLKAVDLFDDKVLDVLSKYIWETVSLMHRSIVNSQVSHCEAAVEPGQDTVS